MTILEIIKELALIVYFLNIHFQHMRHRIIYATIKKKFYLSKFLSLSTDPYIVTVTLNSPKHFL